MTKQGKFEENAPAPASGKQTVARKKMDSGNRLLLSFISSVTSLLLCCTMFFGTTMAWFTDSVTNFGNQITIGTLNVDVKYGSELLSRSNAPIFGKKLWKPNSFDVQKLTIQNKGSLDLGYSLNLLLNTDADSNFQIAKYLKVYVMQVPEDFDTSKLTVEDIQKWTLVGNGTLDNIFTKGLSVISGYLEAGSEVHPTEETYAIALYMTEEVDSSLQGQNMTMNIKLNAYQSDMAKPEAVSVEEAEASEKPDETIAESTEASLPETTSATVPETTVATVPETTEATVPETTAATVPETTAATVPETTAAAVLETTAATVPESTAAVTE